MMTFKPVEEGDYAESIIKTAKHEHADIIAWLS